MLKEQLGKIKKGKKPMKSPVKFRDGKFEEVLGPKMIDS